MINLLCGFVTDKNTENGLKVKGMLGSVHIELKYWR